MVPKSEEIIGIPQFIILEIPHTLVNDSIYDFDWVFLEIPAQNCIMGMLLTQPICST